MADPTHMREGLARWGKTVEPKVMSACDRHGGQYEGAHARPNLGSICNFANNADACSGSALSLDEE